MYLTKPMKKFKSIFLMTLVINSSLLLGQQMPLDFSDSEDLFTPFSGTSFQVSEDPEDNTNEVGVFINNGAAPWQGFFIDLDQPIVLQDQSNIGISFYQTDNSEHSITLKLENGSDVDVEVTRFNNSPGWNDSLSFDFSNAITSADGNTINATGTYSRLTIFIDGGEFAAGTYLIDNIDDGSTPSDPNELDVVYTDLVWADEFNNDGPIDSNNWYHQTLLPNGNSWFNGELQHYTDRIENSYVDDGFLNITAIKENFTDQGVTKSYTSARLNSKFAFTYGRVDVRAKLPEGQGTWPAIWTLGKNINENGAYWDNLGFGDTNWPACGEIDIMEHGLGPVNHVSSALHTPCAGCFGATTNFEYYILNDVANDFHIYSMNWSPDQITFLIDGDAFYTYNPIVKDDSTWPFYEDQYLLLNVAMGGVAGAVDPNFDQSSMVIDYVRVYQNNNLSTSEAFAQNLSVYPNPANDKLYINSDRRIDRGELYNNLGQLIWSKRNTVNAIDVNNFNNGIYILKLYSGEAITIKKVVINN